MRIQLGALTLALTLAAGGASAKDFQPAIIFDMGGKFDKSFNEAAYNGAEQFKKETGIPYLEFEVPTRAQREQALRRMAAGGGTWSSPSASPSRPRSRQIAKEFPEDQVRDHRRGGRPAQRPVGRLQGARGLASWSAWRRPWRRKTGKVGFVGGMDIPLIRNFACGYEQGVKHVEPEGRGVREHDRHHARGLERPGHAAASSRSASSTRAPTWSTPPPAAPASACCRPRPTRASSSIGVDSNQNYLHPGSVLTSMIKRVDVAVYDAFKSAKDGTWKAGVQDLGPEGGRRRLRARRATTAACITPEMEAKLDAAKQTIIAGKLKVKTTLDAAVGSARRRR